LIVSHDLIQRTLRPIRKKPVGIAFKIGTQIRLTPADTCVVPIGAICAALQCKRERRLLL
jgi:hypothetical protein